MKRQLTVAMGLMVLAAPAFATKARLQALGEDVYGSQYVNDNRNIWLNAAQINNHKDLVTFELGNGAQTVDSTDAPRAEGGVYKTMGNLVYGLHLGGASNASNSFRAAAGSNSFEDNNIDVFVGGDSGIKWGANLGYSQSNDDESNADANQKSLRTRLGVISGDTQGYATISLMNESEDGTGNKFDGDLSFQLGAIHAWNGNSLFAEFRKQSGEADPAAGSKGDIDFQQIKVGIGRVTRLNDKANLFTKAQLTWVTAENENTTDGFAAGCSSISCEEYETMQLPVVIGLETEATSWLTLRASIGQTIWGSEEDKKNERGLASTTNVNAGATLKFGELSVDGVVGNTDETGVVGGNTADGKGTLRTDVLMTRVGMTYRF